MIQLTNQGHGPATSEKSDGPMLSASSEKSDEPVLSASSTEPMTVPTEFQSVSSSSEFQVFNKITDETRSVNTVLKIY